MNDVIIERLPRIEGNLRLVLSQTAQEQKVFLESGRSVFTEDRLVGKYPLEAIQQTQLLSAKSGVSHAIAAVSAIENYLQLDPTVAALQFRQILLQLSTLHSHIYHFYWEFLPDYLNTRHFKKGTVEILRFYIGYTPRAAEQGDLSRKIGGMIVGSIPEAANVLKRIQKAIALISGKYPVVMNLIPGGISNFSFSRVTIMKMIRQLERIKPFVESTWPQDVKMLIQDVPDTVNVLRKNVNLISFGLSLSGKLKEQDSYYSDGVLLDGKLEPMNELKITQSIANTFYLPIQKTDEGRTPSYDLKKPGARTWIKGARYDTETMLTGALSRMLVTHFGGSNMEISDRIGQMIDDLGLSTESPNCIASRLLAEVFEGRLYLKAILGSLLDLEYGAKLNRGISFDFSPNSTGLGKVEAPGGSLLHQVFIDDGRITQYSIVTPVNWNVSPIDDVGRTGIVESELNRLHEGTRLTAIRASRLLHSYNIQVLDGTK
ncbi:MAG: hypothetical protein GY866_22645 [Proteobacteria bacterium]|nr:hypothetical protein [Pseudomonadota bacterium]